MRQITWEWTKQMDRRNRTFFRTLGERVTQLRKEHRLTQVQLADMLTLSQATITSYESGQRCIPADVLPRVATILGVSMEELTGTNAKPSKRGPTPKFQHQLEQIARLPKAKQRFVVEMLDTVLHQASR